MESSEFIDAVPQAAYDGGGLLITNPLVLATVLLLGALILWLGWHFGAVKSREDLLADREKVIDAIHERINDKARTAAAAPRNKVVAAAHDLNEEIRKLLGPVVDLTPFGRRAAALDRALAGKPTTRNHDDPEPAGEDHAAAHAPAPPAPAHGEPHPATAHSPAAAASQVNINITNPPPAHGGGGHGHGHGHGDGQPQRDAVRDAVMDICDYWSRTTMKAELLAAQRALLRMPPPKPKLPGSSGGHH